MACQHNLAAAAAATEHNNMQAMGTAELQHRQGWTEVANQRLQKNRLLF
jgi:hypothetical protein